VRLRASLPALAASVALAGWHVAAVEAVGANEARVEAATAAELQDYWTAKRSRWFLHGYGTGSLKVCKSVYRVLYGTR
jgi:hypothetical protein